MRSLLFLFMMMWSCFIVSQKKIEEPPAEVTETTVIYPAAEQFDIWDMRFGHAIMTPINNAVGLDYFSFNFAAHYLYEFNLSWKRNVAFALGAGYDFQRNHLDGYFAADNDNEALTFNTQTSSRTNLQSLSFPAEFRIRIKRKWKIHLGYQLLVPLQFNQKYTLGGDEHEIDIKSISTIQQGLFFRVGYKDFFLFTRFNFTPLFLINDNQEVKNIQIGISLGG